MMRLLLVEKEGLNIYKCDDRQKDQQTGFKSCLWKSICQNFSNELEFYLPNLPADLRIFLRTCYFYVVFDEYLKNQVSSLTLQMDSFHFTSFSLTTQGYFNPYEEANLWFAVLSTSWTKNSFLLSDRWWLSVRYRRISVPESWFSDLLLKNIFWIHYTAMRFVLPFV